MTQTEHPNLRRLLIVSDQHLDPELPEDHRLRFGVYGGLVVRCTYDIDDPFVGAGFKRVLALADTLGAEYILFSELEDPLKSIPVFTYGG